MADRCRVTDDGLSRRQRPLFSAVTRLQELKKQSVECHCRHAETLKEADPGVFVANVREDDTVDVSLSAQLPVGVLLGRGVGDEAKKQRLVDIGESGLYASDEWCE